MRRSEGSRQRSDAPHVRGLKGSRLILRGGWLPMRSPVARASSQQRCQRQVDTKREHEGLTYGRKVVLGDLKLVGEDELQALRGVQERRPVEACEHHREEGRHEVLGDVDWE